MTDKEKLEDHIARLNELIEMYRHLIEQNHLWMAMVTLQRDKLQAELDNPFYALM